MYKHYLKNINVKDFRNNTSQLFADYQWLQRIWTHPYTCRLYEDDFKKLSHSKSKKKLKKENVKFIVIYDYLKYHVFVEN